MKQIIVPMADEKDMEPAAIMISGKIPDDIRITKDKEIPVFYKDWRKYYQQEAKKVVDVMHEHMPQGLVDAIFGELCYWKSTIFRVSAGKEE